MKKQYSDAHKCNVGRCQQQLTWSEAANRCTKQCTGLRYMMIIATSAILLLNISGNRYFMLLPLVVVLPTYFMFYNYWMTCYALAFNAPHLIERDHIHLKGEPKNLPKDSIMRMQCYQYYGFAGTSLLLYFIRVVATYFGAGTFMASQNAAHSSGVGFAVDLLLGIVALGITLLVLPRDWQMIARTRPVPNDNA